MSGESCFAHISELQGLALYGLAKPFYIALFCTPGVVDGVAILPYLSQLV
jgi:hypothetical protein